MKKDIDILADYFSKNILCYQCPDRLKVKCEKKNGDCNKELWKKFLENIVKGE